MAKLNEKNKQLNLPPNPPTNNKNVIPSTSYENLCRDLWFSETMVIFVDGSSTKLAPIEGGGINTEDDKHFQGPLFSM